MTRIKKWFLVTALIGPVHMGEQLATSIEEFYKLRSWLDGYYRWFTWTDPDRATVVLITVVFTAITLVCYALMVGGVPRLFAAALFGLLAAQEFHHVFEAIGKRGYDAGLITCIPYAHAGNVLLKNVWQEFKRTRTSVPAIAPATLHEIGRTA
jgi:hypothetical protein